MLHANPGLRGIFISGVFGAIALVSLIAAKPAAAADEPRGKIEAVQRTVLSSELSARVASLPRRAGESFEAGNTLVELDCGLYRAERDKVATRLAQAKRRRDNRERLAELDSVGQLEVELARLAVEESEAELRIASLNAARCTIEAPFDGRVVRLHASEHQSVKAQQKLLEIVGAGLEARVIVPADWLSWLRTGDAMRMRVEETGATVHGAVTRIGAAVDPVSHTVPVWASLEGAGASLRPGMSGDVTFPGRPTAEAGQ
ncbi:MAG: efflux RND transporter periplasmic adaptor subunit [Halofilum sp. (in: g-proteobacteria)]